MYKRIIRRNGVLLPCCGVIHIYTQDLPQQSVGSLTVLRVAAPTVTNPHIEIAVAAEEQQSPVVICHGVRHRKNPLSAGGIGMIWISLRDVVARDDHCAVDTGVVHEEIAIAHIGWVKGDAQQSTLAA